MKKTILVLVCILRFSAFGQSNGTEGWDLFARVSFESTFFKNLGTYFLVPKFDQKILARVGTEVTLKGYYMPIDLPPGQFVLSQNPYSECFFCGGAGPESVAEVQIKGKLPKLKMDQVIKVRGRLKLNATDLEHLNFILEDAELIK